MNIRAKVRQKLARRLNAPDIGVSLASMAQLGFSPRLIFDVGAYEGEFAQRCLKLWPMTHVACFEPLPQHAESLRGVNDPRITVHECVVGASQRSDVPLHVAETASSVLSEWHESHPELLCDMNTLDRVRAGHHGGRPVDLLKIDTQGYELEVLKGAVTTLENVQAIVAELNLLDVHQGVPLIAEVMTWLSERDFVAYDISELHRRPLDGALWCADLIFVPRNSPLRTDKRWG